MPPALGGPRACRRRHPRSSATNAAWSNLGGPRACRRRHPRPPCRTRPEPRSARRPIRPRPPPSPCRAGVAGARAPRRSCFCAPCRHGALPGCTWSDCPHFCLNFMAHLPLRTCSAVRARARTAWRGAGGGGSARRRRLWINTNRTRRCGHLAGIGPACMSSQTAYDHRRRPPRCGHLAGIGPLHVPASLGAVPRCGEATTAPPPAN